MCSPLRHRLDLFDVLLDSSELVDFMSIALKAGTDSEIPSGRTGHTLSASVIGD